MTLTASFPRCLLLPHQTASANAEVASGLDYVIAWQQQELDKGRELLARVIVAADAIKGLHVDDAELDDLLAAIAAKKPAPAKRARPHPSPLQTPRQLPPSTPPAGEAAAGEDAAAAAQGAGGADGDGSALAGSGYLSLTQLVAKRAADGPGAPLVPPPNLSPLVDLAAVISREELANRSALVAAAVAKLTRALTAAAGELWVLANKVRHVVAGRRAGGLVAGLFDLAGAV